VGTRCADHVTPLDPQKLALTSPTGGGGSVGIVRSRTKATELYISRLYRETVGHFELKGNIDNSVHCVRSTRFAFLLRLTSDTVQCAISPELYLRLWSEFLLLGGIENACAEFP
jgi:hypothetical protein